MSYLYAFLGFAALIILHETGHFLAAKAVGMRVERFSLFFGPMLVRTRRGETEYGIGPIPLGGYVKISGMNPHERLDQEDEIAELKARLNETSGEPERERIAGRLATLQAQVRSIKARAYYNQPVWKRVVVIMAGPAVNLLLAFAILWALFLANGQIVVVKRVAQVEQRTPAARFLKPGDRVVSVDGVSSSAQAIHNAIARHHCPGRQVPGCHAATPARVVVRRHGRLLRFSIRPRYNTTYRSPLLGFEFGSRRQSVGAGQAASLTGHELWTVTTKTVSAIGRIFEPRERRQLHTVVGVFKLTQQSFAFNASVAFWILALISLTLAVINLFPFLPLDGGHVFWALAEKVRGRRIPFSVMERASAVGFVLIVIVFMIGLSNDISTLTGPGFSVR